jgi:uncharacterized protein (TIGR02145 family)
MSKGKGSLIAGLAAALVLAGCGGGGSGNGKLTTTVTPANAGTVTRDPEQTVYPAGMNVNLTATAADGYVFKEWKGVVSGTEKTISVAMAGNMKMTAVFEKVNIETIPADGGTVSYEQDEEDATVTFTAQAASGYKFKEWTGAVTGTESIIEVETVGNAKVTAVFEKIPYGSLADARDGKKYRTIKIGNQTWMAENLNHETPNSWCYDDNPDNCAKYGRLYTWDAAMKACPAGWHLPTKQECEELVSFVGVYEGGTKLKSQSPDWNGTNDYGFSALPGGNRFDDGKISGYGNLNSSGTWWTATEFDDSVVYALQMTEHKTTDVNRYHKSKCCLRWSVRCLQD